MVYLCRVLNKFNTTCSVGTPNRAAAHMAMYIFSFNKTTYSNSTTSKYNTHLCHRRIFITSTLKEQLHPHQNYVKMSTQHPFYQLVKCKDKAPLWRPITDCFQNPNTRMTKATLQLQTLLASPLPHPTAALRRKETEKERYS